MQVWKKTYFFAEQVKCKRRCEHGRRSEKKMLQFALLSLQFCSCALTDLPLCQVSPYSPPPLMFATARTPPRCRTKISLDTLKKQTDKRIIFIFQFLYAYHFCKNTLRERSLPKSMRK